MNILNRFRSHFMLNVEEFLGTQVTTATATKFELVPENEEGYVAQIANDGIDLKDFKYGPDTERAGQTGYRMTVKWEIEDPEGKLREQMGRPATITQSILLDITSEGALDMGKGKNVNLGRLREAVDQNKDGQPWQPAMLLGQMARISVKHSVNKKNGELQAEVNKVVHI